MIRLYHENPEFGEFNRFDSDTGILNEISYEEFEHQKKIYSVYSGSKEITHVHFPRRIYFQITRKCNLECDYCFIKADSMQPSLDKEVIMNLANYLGDKGLMEVRLTGGEPTIHPDFKEIFTAFRNNNVYVSVATNGLWKKEILDFLITQKNIWLIVSIDGNKEVHNKVRNNSYDRIIQNIKNFKAQNPSGKLRINTVLTKDNYHDLKHLASLTKELDAESITLIPLRPQVRVPFFQNKILNAKEFEGVIQEMIKYKKEFGIKFTTTIETDYKEEIMPDKIFKKKSSCAAGREGTNLDFDVVSKKLFLYGCSYCPASDPKEDWNIREPFLAGEFGFDEIGMLDSIWNKNENWTVFRDLSLKSEACKSCDYYATKCTGSCPIQNIDFQKIGADEHTKSQLMNQMKNNAEWYCYKNF